MTVDGHMKSKRFCCAHKDETAQTVLGEIKIGCTQKLLPQSIFCQLHAHNQYEAANTTQEGETGTETFDDLPSTL